MPRRAVRRSTRTLLGLMIALAPTVAEAGPADVYYERAFMSAANQRCSLFPPDLASALESAAAQARGAALRAGLTVSSIAQTSHLASSRAAQTPCGSHDLAIAATHVRAAFDGYAHLSSMSFPGDLSGWRAERSVARRTSIWRLSQAAGFGDDRLIFGLAGRGDASALIAAVHFADGARPYAARLILRDTNRAPEPFIGRFSQAGRTGLAARLPTRAATTSIPAEARDEADPALLPPGATSGLVFRFPRAASDALADLDPREAVALEFLTEDATGDHVRTAYIEVGDFAAGRAFLAAAQR